MKQPAQTASWPGEETICERKIRVRHITSAVPGNHHCSLPVPIGYHKAAQASTPTIKFFHPLLTAKYTNRLSPLLLLPQKQQPPEDSRLSGG